jgi:hypothetical protein
MFNPARLQRAEFDGSNTPGEDAAVLGDELEPDPAMSGFGMASTAGSGGVPVSAAAAASR